MLGRSVSICLLLLLEKSHTSLPLVEQLVSRKLAAYLTAGILDIGYAADIKYSNLQRTRSFRCYSSTRDTSQTPQLLKIAVNGVTEILRLFSSAKERSDGMKYTERDEPSISGIDDVMVVLKSDYDSAYFVTGNFTPTIYAEDCIFEDPTIKFRGKDLYSRNLKLLVPFFDRPSIVLQKIEKGMNSQTNFVLATWELRTYLKLPWRPLISIEGSTVYDLGDEFKIVRHAESWNVSALEAVAQIFAPSFERIGE